MLYNACVEPTRSPTEGRPGFAVSPSAKLLKPFYWAAAIIAGLIFFYSNNTGTDSLYPLLILPAAIVIWTLCASCSSVIRS